MEDNSIFKEMQQKGFIEFARQHLSYNLREYSKLVRIYDETLLIGKVELKTSDGSFPANPKSRGIEQQKIIGTSDRRN